MKILILGGTGFLGPEIVRAAQANKHELTLFNRGKTQPGLFPDVEKLQGDRDKDDYKSLEGRSWDAAIDTSANMPAWMKASTGVLKGKVKQYVFTSSISVYPMDSYKELGKTEDAAVEPWPEGGDERHLDPQFKLYGPGKAYCERIVQEAFPGHATIVRPGLIVGPGDYSDRFTYWPVRIDKGGEVLAPGMPDAHVQFIDARDLGAWLVKLVEDGHAGVYNATGPAKPLSMAEMLYGIKAVTTAGAQFTWVDEKFLLEHEVGPWMEMPLWVPHDEESRGFQDINVDRALAAGLTFRALADTARDTLAWYKNRAAHPATASTAPGNRPRGMRAGLSADKETNVLKAWHERQKGDVAATAPATMPAR